MKRILSAIAVVVLASAWLRPVVAQCAELPGCVLVWADEFDGTEVDPAKWTFQLGDGAEVGLPGGWGNNEEQWYRAENATVAGGLLTITAREESFGNADYTSARMRSLGKGDWTFGRFEMRAKMPIGQGLWPAFWMLPSASVYGGWAASGEIDIVEYLGNEPDRVLGTIHYGGSFPANVFAGADYFLPADTFNDDFHIFAIEWEFGEIRWYVDGNLYSTRNGWYSTGGSYPAPFDEDFHLLLNLAVGGNLPGSPNASTQFPQELVVDYIRVYQLPPSVSVTSPTESDMIAPGSDVTITATVDDPASVQRVEFYQDKVLLGEAISPPYEITVPGVAAGCYTISARALDLGGQWESSLPVAVTVGSGCPQAPYRMTPVALPGTVEVEDYDIGGQGLSYSDLDATNNGGAYRPGEGVDLEGTTDAGGGFNVGWVAPGEWIEYAVDVAGGSYDIELRVASAAAGGTLHLELDGVDVTGPIGFGGTGGWQNWTSVNASGVTLAAGLQTLRVAIDGGEFNLNRIVFSAAPTAGVGAVPDGRDVPGTPLSVGRGAGDALVLSWSASCQPEDGDYVVYEGTLGAFGSHQPATCSTAGATSWTLTPAGGSRYFLVAPADSGSEGSRGRDGDGVERPAGVSTCLPVDVGTCF